MGHYLKQNAANELPTCVVCVDTETYVKRRVDISEDGEECLKEHHTLRLGAYFSLRRRGNEWQEEQGDFRTKEQFWGHVSSLCFDGRVVYVIGHNMAYDYAILNMDKWISDNGFIITQFIIGQAFIIVAKRGKQTVKFIDSMNWFKSSLRSLGETFGMAKGEIADFTNVSDEELLPYCINDANIVKTVFLTYVDFISQHDLGNFSMTAAGQAFNSYRHRFMPAKSILIHGNSGLYDLEQKSYRGGRSDIFRQGRYDELVKLDINSMYPFVMAKFDYPTKPVSKEPIFGISLDEVIARMEEYFVVGDFDITLSGREAAGIAVKRDKLIFPVGHIAHAYLTSPEIEFVLKHGTIDKVNFVSLYEKRNLFEEYVKYFYDIKNNSKGPMKALSKLFLNSLYGKFGQRKFGEIKQLADPASRSIMDSIDSNVFYDHNNHKVMQIGNEIYEISGKKEEPSYDASPIISSAVTAYARMYLWELMLSCGLDNVFYCDTDSIFTNREGYEKLDALGLIDNKELGKLKVESLGSAVLRGPKDYDWIDSETGEVKQTIKGVPRNAIQKENGDYLYNEWQTGLRRYTNPIAEGIEVVQRSKHLKREYDKGFVDNDGLVHPLVLDERDGTLFTIKSKRTERIEVVSSRVNWTSDYKKRVSVIDDILGIGMLQSSALLQRVIRSGGDYDTFPWDELAGGDLTYHELLAKVNDLIGGSATSKEFSDMVALYDDIKRKFVLDPVKWGEELHNIERELVSSYVED